MTATCKSFKSLFDALRRLAADFPGWDFSAQQTYDGLALVAVRRHGADQPGTCALITGDPGELRRALGETA